MSTLDKSGYEIPDQTPVAIPAYIKKYDQRDSIRDMIRQALSQEAENAGYETFEEADDFDVGDDYDPTSPYEECFDPQTGQSSWEPDEGNALQHATEALDSQPSAPAQQDLGAGSPPESGAKPD